MSIARDFAVRYLREGRPLTASAFVEALEEFEMTANPYHACSDCYNDHPQCLCDCHRLSGGHQLNGKSRDSQEPNPASPVAGGLPADFEVADAANVALGGADEKTLGTSAVAFYWGFVQGQKWQQDRSASALAEARKEIERLRAAWQREFAVWKEARAALEHQLAEYAARLSDVAGRLKQTEKERDRLKEALDGKSTTTKN